MKRTIVNIAAVLTALIVGLTINNACAEKIDPENPEESFSKPRYFMEDGLLFGPDGRVCNRIKSISGIPLQDYLITGGQQLGYEYKYDTKGRLSEIKWLFSSGTISITYAYSELKMSETVSMPDGSVTTTYQYYPAD